MASRDAVAELSDVPLRVVLDDGINMKSVLDDTVCSCILESGGYDEDVRSSNFKLAIGGVACVVALVVQLYPVPFPESTPVLFGFILLYFALQATLVGVSAILDEDAFLTTRQGDDAARAICVSSTMERFSTTYDLTIKFADDDDTLGHGGKGGKGRGKKGGKVKAKKPTKVDAAADAASNYSFGALGKLSLDVTQLFHADGIFHREAFEAAVNEMLASFLAFNGEDATLHSKKKR
jgi:hypothetical protein